MNQYIIQGIGVIGIVVMILSFQLNKRSTILNLHIAAGALFAVHFYLLSAWTGVAMGSLAAVRAAVFHLREDHREFNKIIYFYLFLGLFWLGGALTWEGPHSLLPIAAMTLSCISLWSIQPKRIRLYFLAGRPMWFFYGFVVGSYAGMLAEVAITISVLVGIKRFDQ